MLILVRGIPGSGKSTYVETEYKDTYDVFLEADMYFTKNGEYKFDGSKIKKAHEWCQNTARVFLDMGNSVVVSNTFTKLWEMKPYFEMAKESGHDVMVIRMTGEYQNVHGVPQEKVEEMKKRFEDCPGEYLRP